MIDVTTAGRLLDFGSRIGSGQRADAQLEGAVAIHNILDTQGVAYLADEVGMGKTYVALGALALFRHFQPDFRVLVIAPRGNIQAKWLKEMRNFVKHNVRFPDLRVKAMDGRPVRPLVTCENLLDLVREATLAPSRDFFVRLTSFSLAMPWRDDGERKEAWRLRDGLRRSLPWMADEVFDMRLKNSFKDNFARAVCCGLPAFDLVIVDEAHNLKHGFGGDVASRNRVLGLAMGHSEGAGERRLFPGYGSRAKRVLFLSATPVEESYRQLWNQLDVFDKGRPFESLNVHDVNDDDKKELAKRFLVRRVTEIRSGDSHLTKNQYRREWRRGGVARHDEPIGVVDAKQRLIVALIQKKVSELLGDERFQSSFQVGMLASFESFLETTKLKRDDDAGVFDDASQSEDEAEKLGIDVRDINRLAQSYRKRFGVEMPHPKMDALVEALESAWRTGEKALVFVRRVASVGELKRKLDERYDTWLIGRMKKDLPESLHQRLDEIVAQYRREQEEAGIRSRPVSEGAAPWGINSDEQDLGGHDTFFSWFFRGQGPRGVVSGATIQQRLGSSSGTYSTFFKDNHVAALLGCQPGETLGRLAEVLGMNAEAVRDEVRRRSRGFLGRVKNPARAKRFEAVQAGAVELLVDHPASPAELRERAGVVWREWFEETRLLPRNQAIEAPDIGSFLEESTFFTALRRREILRARLWPVSEKPAFTDAFREQEMRAQLLATASRLGHCLVDLYGLAINRLRSLQKGAQEDDEGKGDLDTGLVGDFLHLLERQMATPLSAREWGAYDELAAIGENFDLILDVNEPEVGEAKLGEASVRFARLLRGQQPVGGMSGQVNQTLVRQFRMPGYPLVLVSTDLLQEGEDLHTFCSAVHHYGISWTPSSMEQRTGRIDRVRSASDRRLSAIESRSPTGDEKLQVFFPHLEDTVEILQVQRVLERMNGFLELMHEGLTAPLKETSSINAAREFARGRRHVPQLEGRLQTAFPIEGHHLRADSKSLAAEPSLAGALLIRFQQLASPTLAGMTLRWEPIDSSGQLMGTVLLQPRQQPFTLLLRSIGEHAVVRCVSPVGRVVPGSSADAVLATSQRLGAKLGAIQTVEERTYDLTVEGEVLLAANADSDAARVGRLIQRIAQQADRLEHDYLDGVDEPLPVFKEDLFKEATHNE